MSCHITRPYPIEMVLLPVGKRLDEGLSRRPHQICKICKLRVSSWNVGTMHGTANEVVETID